MSKKNDNLPLIIQKIALSKRFILSIIHKSISLGFCEIFFVVVKVLSNTYNISHYVNKVHEVTWILHK